MQTIAVIDFETSGLGPSSGGRATEIAAVLVREGRIVDSFQSLMHSGVWVPPFIEQLTGISNAMLADAPPAAEVMRELARFTQGCPLVAHNAAFDRGFWQAEMALAGCAPDSAHEFVCTVLLARRLYPDAPNCKLGSLVRHFQLPDTGRAHRALADAMSTAHLLLRLQQDIARGFEQELSARAVDHALLMRLQRAGKSVLRKAVLDHVARQPGPELAGTVAAGRAQIAA